MTTRFLIACAIALASACAGGAEPDQRAVDPPAGSGGAGGESGAMQPPDAIELPCPANNLTQACTCSDGRAGRQICTETIGWGGCDCGQGDSDATADAGLQTAAMTPPANLDTSITFDDYVMPQTFDPDECQPGTYAGTFQCNYTSDVMMEPFMVEGIVSFVLSRGASSEVLTIEDGLLDGWGGLYFFAYLTGELSCGTGEIAGTVDEGFYNPIFKGGAGAMDDMPGINCVITDKEDPGYEPWTVNLEGQYTGALEPSTDTITGMWSLQPIDIGGTCDGTFSVTLAP
jgi:hypothetical protein